MLRCCPTFTGFWLWSLAFVKAPIRQTCWTCLNSPLLVLQRIMKIDFVCSMGQKQLYPFTQWRRRSNRSAGQEVAIFRQTFIANFWQNSNRQLLISHVGCECSKLYFFIKFFLKRAFFCSKWTKIFFRQQDNFQQFSDSQKPSTSHPLTRHSLIAT